MERHRQLIREELGLSAHRAAAELEDAGRLGIGLAPLRLGGPGREGP